jgi:hypothetical protein
MTSLFLIDNLKMDLIDNDEFKTGFSVFGIYAKVSLNLLFWFFGIWNLFFKLRIRRRHLQYFAIKIFIPSQRKIKDVICHFVRFNWRLVS